MQGVRTKEVTIISDNEVSRWHNPVQYGNNTFFLELGSDAPPPPRGGWTRGGGGGLDMGGRGYSFCMPSRCVIKVCKEALACARNAAPLATNSWRTLVS